MRKSILSLIILLGLNSAAFALDVDVLYYWANPRCANCKKMEQFTQSAVQKMNDNSVHFKSLDMSKPENKAAVKKYKLYTKSVVISKNVQGKEQWKNLDGIWTKVNNQKAFEKYITDEVKKFKGE
ncbi:MAG: nitrophenyl compound nitroreductase subunit ArsF family protein [Fusobacterium sp.]|nr:nitrophenyl compound nitroreductase subunit ArsF family protein [Fusobacterium sp.]